jgi:hypothetical protein
MKVNYVSFFVKQIMGILGLQIEIECVFNLTSVLIALKCCKLR